MKNKVTFLYAFVIVLCMVSCDYIKVMYIENRTSDAVIIGSSRYCCIDSVKHFLEGREAKYDSKEPVFREKEKLNLADRLIIPSGSLGGYGEWNAPLFSHNQDRNGYFFIINVDTARNHTWGEICRDTLYETLIVTQEMVKQAQRQGIARVIEWKGTR